MSIRNILPGGQADKDPYFKNVSLLLSGDNSTNGGQNNTFLDSSSNNFAITRNGNVTQGSFSPFGDRWSNYFNGSTDYLTTAGSLGLGSGAFTIECFLFYSTSSTHSTMFSCGNGDSINTCLFFVNVSNKLSFYNGGDVAISTTNVPVNTWNHVACTRDNSNNITLWLNGTAIATGSRISDINSTIFQVGRGYGGVVYSPIGNISNLRIIKGTALYTSTFTPPTSPLTAVSGTVLLTCQSNRFIDNSTYTNAITVNGTPSVQKFSPFSPVSEYNASVDGGSAYFDGSGDYISTTDSVGLGSGNFTIEGWFYKTGYFDGAFSIGATGSTDYAGITFANGTGIYYSNTGTSWTNSFTVPNTTNQWNHIAFVRNGTTITAYVNGVSVGSGAVSGALANKSGLILVGVKSDYMGNGFPGYISNFRIIKGTALYTSTFTPPTSPLTNVPNTQLLCNFTNGNIIDSSLNNDLETVGNAQISTSVKKYGTGSMYIPSGGAYAKTGSSPNNAFGAENYTWEAWIYPIAYPDNGWVLVNQPASDLSDPVAMAFGIVFGKLTTWNGGSVVFADLPVSLNTWSHIAVVRSSTSLFGFLNGVKSSTIGTDSRNLSQTDRFFMVPQTFDRFNGYIDDLRITKGIARYTANFTPPTAPLPKQ